MIYTVIQDEQILEVDDNIFYDDQSKSFKLAFDSLKRGNTAEFDNCRALLLGTGRIIITYKDNEDGKI